MRYCQSKRDVTVPVSIEEYFDEEGSVTKILIMIPLHQYNMGFSLELLTELIKGAAETHKLTTYQIFHDPKGLVLVGRH